jgi:general nucleoside transport system ATP-binding protein
MQIKLEVFNIHKSFGPVQANKDISLRFEKGKIHAILGENGAGKSTLMNILYGLIRPDQGSIHLDGKHLDINNPRVAIQNGIGMIHQHFMLAAELSVLENVIAGLEPTKIGFVIDQHEARERILNISDQFGLEVDPGTKIKDLSVGAQQRVEILKLLFRNAEILIMDEPTAVLTLQEITNLFKVLKLLSKKGRTILFITHKLKEVLKIADHISVLRNGELITTKKPLEVNEQELATLMVGRGVELTAKKTKPKFGEVMLSIQNLQVLDDYLNTCVDGVSLEIRIGEILGIAGVQGNGQTELVESVTGLRPPILGKVFIDSVETTNLPRREIIELGVGHIPEDRQRDGLILSSPISINLVLCSYYKPPFTKGLELQEDVIYRESAQRASDYDVRTPDIKNPAESLSGGNQQKVIIAREFSRDLRLLVASQPTRGLDVGSIEYVHQQIISKRDAGTAVMLVSTELDEIMAMSDRIAVIYRGKILAVLDSRHAVREEIGLLMAGVIPEKINESFLMDGKL